MSEEAIGRVGPQQHNKKIYNADVWCGADGDVDSVVKWGPKCTHNK